VQARTLRGACGSVCSSAHFTGPALASGHRSDEGSFAWLGSRADTASIVTGFGPLLPMLVMIVKASRRGEK
jgi:hypothetical protein